MNLTTLNRTTRALVCVALFFLAFSIRWYGIEESGNQNDEQLWYYRAAHLMNDILSPFEITNIKLPFEAYDVPWVRTGEGKPYPFDINQRARHPGTPPSLLMGLSYFFLAKDTNDASLDLLPLRAAMRLPQVVLGSLLAVFLFILGRRLWGDHVALLAACLYMAEPYTIGYSRLARIDVSESLFIMLTMLTYTIGYMDNRRGMRLLAGICLGIGLAHRPYTFLVLPVLLSWRILSDRMSLPGSPTNWARIPNAVWVTLRPEGSATRMLLIPISLLSAWAIADILWLHQVFLPASAQLVADAYEGQSFLQPLNDFFSAKMAAGTLKPLEQYLSKLGERWDRKSSTIALAPMVAFLTAYVALNARKFARLLSGFTDRTDAWALGLAFIALVLFFPNFWGNPAMGILEHVFLVASLPHVTGESSTLMPTSPLIYWVYWIFHLSPILTASFLLGAALVCVQLWRALSNSGSQAWSQRQTNLFLCALWVIAILGLLGLPSGRKSMKNLNFVISAICVLGAYGLLATMRTIWQSWRRPAAITVISLIAAAYVAQNTYLLRTWYPYYQLLTLDIAGDPQSWQRRELIGVGEGFKEVGEYLASVKAENDVVACATGHNNLVFFHKGQVLDHQIESIQRADWLATNPKIEYCIPREHELVQHISGLRPERIFYHNQIELARLYRLKPWVASTSKTGNVVPAQNSGLEPNEQPQTQRISTR
jgi:hypothetical protein